MSRLIKKYKNRRLYDTEKSQYITMEDLQKYVVEDISFRVEDSATGKEITNIVLLQILVEMEGGASQLLSSEMLRQLITLANHPLHQSIKTTLGQMFSTLETQIKRNPYLTEYQELAAAWNNQLQELMSEWQKAFKPPKGFT